ncbi:MAG TPA: very short patch repair endonuclease [Phycisphaerae bacterium]|nr:very short patch repair endonuclease [Phycisphaerae bacterium]HNU43730.1 very short patch repair endonuclease [Phycisphaerae bacterium]
MSHWPGNAKTQRTTFGSLSRAQLMSRVRSKGNETTEERLAALLRKTGLRGWRRHQPLPGRPDFVWARNRFVVFVDGCFWHGHDCGRNVTPKTNAKAWRNKIDRNKARDRYVTRFLRRHGWSVLRIWECELARNPERCVDRIRRALRRNRSSGTRDCASSPVDRAAARHAAPPNFARGILLTTVS